jgi:glycosyltransferase involved in cell wall biosynthesis
LKIVHFSTSDCEGGSARSANRIHSGLRNLGHTSHMLVGTKSGTDDDVDTVHGGGAKRIADRLAEETTRHLGLQYYWYPSGRRVRRHAWVQGVDIIQLYNTHGGYLSHRLLPALAARAPIVWRLSDMWSFTGHCAYAGSCERWRTGCGHCPDLQTHPALPFDTTARLWRTKQEVVARAHPTIVVPSRWLEAFAHASPIFRGLAVHRIANGIDRAVFRPIPQATARTILGLPLERKIVLYCAQVAKDNPRKGSADAIEAYHRLVGRADIDVAVVGQGGESLQALVPQRVHALGYIHDDRLLAAAYSAADVMIAPSTVENLPNTILEAMACGTPVVAYAAGGIGDAIRHRDTGWLVPAGDRAALSEGIADLLADTDMMRHLSDAGARLIEQEFDAVREAQAFADLYAHIRGERSARLRAAS